MRNFLNSAGSARSVFFNLVVFLFCLLLSGPLLAEEYGSITGTVYEADGTTPIPGLQVYFQPDGCDGESAHGADTDINGHYSITGVPPGEVIVRACANCNNQPYVPVWYDNDTGVRDCEQALDVLVTANETTDGIDFRLDPGVMISGRVTDTQGNPIPDVRIEAFDSLCGYNYLGDGRTDDQGYYITRAVPSGDIYIRVCPECDDHMFRNTWWTGVDSSGSTRCSDAQNLNLAVGVNAVDIDFTLEYPILVEVKRYQRQDDSFDTWYGIYFSDFDNFDLDSVVSITMTGPSGSPIYHYNRGGGDGNDFVKNQWNGFHYNAFGAEPEEGEYLFDVITDDFSTTVHHVRNENKTMPVVDGGTMTPADGSVTSSRVPVFEWNPIEDHQMPLYYRVQVYDDAGYRVFNSGWQVGLRNIALPEGLLEPGRTYTWSVQVNETDDFRQIENVGASEIFSITMADTFNSGTNPPAIDLDGWGAVHSSRSSYDATLCWIEVVDHDGIAYDGSSHQVTVTFNGETHPLYHVRSDSASIANYEYWDTNIPAPAGEYVFSVTDPDGNITTLSETLEVNPVAVPDHNTFNVLPNGTSPTITWNAVPDVVKYRIRIYDMNWNTVWHGYPLTKSDLAYTVPPGVLQPNTLYRYRIRSWNQHYPYNFDNESVSDYRTFFTGEETITPFIEELDGAATLNSGEQENRLYFWVKIHDAQGVPDDIQSVTATFPDGTTVPLALQAGAGIPIIPNAESATSGFYSLEEDLETSFTSGDYTITVEDLAGNIHSITDTLMVNPIGYPADASVNAEVNGTLVNVTWEEIDDAAFYRLEIYDMDGNRLHNVGTTQNAYIIPAGYLPENTPYQYRITAWREYFEQGVHNSSESVMKVFETGSNRNMDIQTVILTATGAETTIAGGDSAAVYGTAVPNHVIVESRAYVELVNFPGSNLIEFQSEAAMFMVSRSGTLVTFQGYDGTTLKIPATTNDQTIMFNNDSFARVLRIQDNQVMLDDQVVTPTSTSIDGGSEDASECGAYVAPGVWKEFDCYNLAAIGKTTNDDPFTTSWRLIGGYWQWGRKGPDPSQWYDTNTENFAHGPTGPGESEVNGDSISNWNNDCAPDGAWSDSYKTANDPCPNGFRVPTISQWEGVMNNNTQSPVGTWISDDANYSSGRFFGMKLMLPAAGYRGFYNGNLAHRGSTAAYWSSSGPDNGRSDIAMLLDFDNVDDKTNSNYRYGGHSVRCIAE